MITYSKYTNGESYVIDNYDYVGPFHIYDGLSYSGASHTEESLLLIPKNTFMGEINSSGYETDTNYNNISSISPYYSNSFDILNKQGLDSSLGSINHNNLIIFKSLILNYPTIYKFEENNAHFYSLSSSTDYPSGKLTKFNIEPFAISEDWSFMDEIQSGTFLIDSFENFKYICSTGTKNFVIGGSFLNKNPIKILESVDQHPDLTKQPPTFKPDYTYNIEYDLENEKIITVNTESINIYDASNYQYCDNLLTSNLIDQISLKETDTIDYIWNRTHIKWNDLKEYWTTRFKITNTNNPEFIKFGKDFRTGISQNVLHLSNKYSSDVFKSINLSSYDIKNVLTLNIRNLDDYIVILHKMDSELFVTFIDSANVSDFKTSVLKSISNNAQKYTIKFSEFDSNIFNVYTEYEYQSRYISNPEYPSGRLESCDLFYPKKYKWGELDHIWKYFNYSWNYSKKKSNYYNNLASSELVKNNKMYILHHNVGRLYAISQNLENRNLENIPNDLEKFFTGVICSESSLGLYFNTAISNLVKDTLNIFNKSSGSFEISEYTVINRELEDILYDVSNLYINGNETINIITLQRIFILITQIQSRLLPVSVEN